MIEIEVTRVEAPSRKLNVRWTCDNVDTMTMGPSTERVHPSAKRVSDRREATIWKRLRG